MAILESRIFCERLAEELSDSPMLEKVVLQLTEEVRVDWVSDCGLYILVRLLRSYFEDAKLTLAERLLKGLALASWRWLHCSLKLFCSEKSGMPLSPVLVS